MELKNIKMKKIILLFLLVATIAPNIFAQTEEVQLRVKLKNDDVLTGTTSLRTIPFITDYGTLEFSIDQINSIQIGLTDSRFDKAKLLNLLDKVEYGTDDEKLNAFDQIVKMDEGAIPFIKAYLNSSSGGSITETDINTKVLYEVMLAKHKVSRNFRLNDVLTYKNEFKVEGNYSFSDLTIDTDYGLITIERNDIARIDVKLFTNGISNKNSFKLFANQHISANKENGWLNTGMLVKKGDRISIDASGQIVLASLSGNTYTPDGGVNGSIGAIDDKISYGQVVYKIGQGGNSMKAGDKLNTYAQQTGILYISINESVFNSANSGYYTVNINID